MEDGKNDNAETTRTRPDNLFCQTKLSRLPIRISSPSPSHPPTIDDLEDEMCETEPRK